MKCPFCRATTTEVYNSRSTRFGAQIWRRRRCQACHEAFTTYEAPDLGFLTVTKQSGKSEPYSRAKLFASIAKACADLPRPQVTVDDLTDTVEAKILDSKQPSTTTQIIAKTVLITLKHFHTAAFVRYLAYQTQLSSNTQLTRELKKYQ